MRKKWIFIAPAAMLAMLAFVAIGGVIVQELWNWLLPPLFGFRLVTFWEALGILVLSRILFGGFGFHGGSRSGMRQRIRDRMVDRMADRWEGMTPEERERFRQRVRERCGFDPSAGESKTQ